MVLRFKPNALFLSLKAGMHYLDIPHDLSCGTVSELRGFIEDDPSSQVFFNARTLGNFYWQQYDRMF